MKSVFLLAALLAISLSGAFAVVTVRYYKGSGCAPGQETKAACTLYTAGSTTTTIGENEQANWQFNTTDVKPVDNIVYVQGFIWNLYVTADTQSGFLTHATPVPSVADIPFGGPGYPPGEVERIDVSGMNNNTQFEYYEITITDYLSPSSGSMVLPSVFALLSVFALALF